MPEGTLKAFANHGEVSQIVSADDGDCEAVLGEFAKAGIDITPGPQHCRTKGLLRLSNPGTN
jgi:transaldolase